MARRQADAVMDQHPTVSLASANNAGAYSESMAYTFGDNQEASRRLRRLAEVYEPETRDLLNAVSSVCYGHRFELALDLGCGPGWSTHLIEATLSPKRIIGLEASGAYVAEARSNQPQLEFIRHDVLTIPFPVNNADFIFCRFLLTHLPSPRAALESWAQAARSGAILAIHETEALHSTHPAFSRYYEMVAQMQQHYGQELNVGALLDDALTGTSWRPIRSDTVVLEKPARDMAQLHVANLRTWGSNDFAVQTFDKCEMKQLESDFGSIASGSKEADVVYNTARRIIARRI
ncbi:MAG: class I SAM-dependent methyltransferase [Acidobacteriaceae bacterium]